MHPFCARARARALAHTDTHSHIHTPPPKFRFSARGGWGRGGSKGCADNGERKSECQGLRVYLAGGRGEDSKAPAPGRGHPHLQLCSDFPFLFSSLPPSRFFPSTFSSLCVSPAPAHLPPPLYPPPPRGPEGTSDFFLQQVGVIHIKHFTTTHQEK